MTKGDFQDFLQSLNIFTSEKISERMYYTIDTDHSGSIEFKEFMEYLVLMLNGRESDSA